MSSTTPDMQLVLPDPGVTPGPAWASELNTALERVSEHDHTSGNGVQLGTASLNINGDLTFNSHNIIDLNSLVLDSLSADPSTATTVYVKNGELFYVDDSAQVVQITSNGSVAGATGTIGGMTSIPPDINPSATFSSFNLDFTFNHDASRPAKLNISDVALYPFTVSPAAPASDYVSLLAPAALGAQYDWTFPLAVPSKTSPLVWSGAGVVDDIELNDGQFLIGATAGAVAAGSIAGTANQVTVTNAANLITLALPQDIATTSSPTFSTPIVTRLTVGLGTEALPAIRFSGDTNTGMYSTGDGDLAFTNNGTQRLLIDGGGAHQFTGNLTVTGDLTTDEIIPGVGGSLPIAGSVNIDGGGAFKVTTYTGTLVAGDDITLTPGGTVLGAFGFTNVNGGTTYAPMPTTNLFSGSGGSIYFQRLIGSSTEVGIENSAGGTSTYRVVVFHT